MKHILIVADGRSPITRNWLHMLSGLDCRVSLVSTYPCQPPQDAVLLDVLPVGFSSLAGGQVQTSPESEAPNKKALWKRMLLNRLRPLLLLLRSYLAPLNLASYQTRLNRIVMEAQPDLVHALRIPFEGMLAAHLPQEIPVLISTWGNDLTLHARASFLMARRTRQTLERADGLLADASRDLRLAYEWGLRNSAPGMVMPGNGGLDIDEIQHVAEQQPVVFADEIPSTRPLIINPRGFRPGSVHQDTFFRCIPLVLEQMPDAFFICSGMLGQPQALQWIRKLNLQDHILLLPYLPQQTLWQLFSRVQVYVSLSSHDGTPNTLLEALACGCFPVVGDIESLREWITDEHNGLLVNPQDANQAAHAILKVLSNDRLRQEAGRYNLSMLKERADIHNVRIKMRSFLEGVLSPNR